MKKIILLTFFFCSIFTLPTFAESITNTKSTTTNKVYKLPKDGVRIKAAEANYTFFPTKLDFSPEKKILIVSRKWQTACLYDESGNIYIATTTNSFSSSIKSLLNKPLCIQSATGKKDFPTELGLYNIQTKYGKDYKSTFYTTNGEKPKEKNEGAPMPYAMHIGRIIGRDFLTNTLWYDFSDGTAIHEKQTVTRSGAMPFVSHGCIAIEKDMGLVLQNIMRYGELVLIVNEQIPNNISDMISISK